MKKPNDLHSWIDFACLAENKIAGATLTIRTPAGIDITIG